MTDDQIRGRNSAMQSTRHGRRASLQSLVLLMTLALGACQPSTPPQDKIMNQNGREIAYFSVSANSYIGRPLVEIRLNGVDVGSGGGSVRAGVAVPLGPQVMTWRLGGPEGMPGNGDTVRDINQPVLSRQAQEMRYLGVHVYPDRTLELIPQAYWPEMTERGEALLREQRKNHGQ